MHFAPGTLVQVGAAVIHTSHAIWGNDALIFRPTRWLNGDEGQSPFETLIEPPRGTFLPWPAGPRYCPGIKMAQVEFVSVMRSIFTTWKVEAVPYDNESVEAARQRLSTVIADSSLRLTMQVNRPKEVVLRWIKR